MSADEPMDRYQRAMDDLRGLTHAYLPGEPRPDCPDDDVLAALADGSIAAAERVAWIPHLGSCRRCKHELASLVRALNDPDISRAAALVDGGVSRWRMTAVPLIAAAALLLAVFTRPDEPAPGSEPSHRAPVLAPATAPIATSPVGPVEEAVYLRWSAVPGADRYRVTLFAVDGRILHEGETADTYMKLPESFDLTQSSAYLWQVHARTDFDRWVSSDLVEFRVVAPKP